MKETTFYKGHRWTQEEIVAVMALWAEKLSPQEIASRMNSTPFAIAKLVVRLRKLGIPLERRHRGHVAGRSNKPWTQAEIEYLIRRRRERSTLDEISFDLGRTHSAVSAMVGKLRSNDVPVPMYGNGVRRLWDANSLRATFAQEHNLT